MCFSLAFSFNESIKKDLVSGESGASSFREFSKEALDGKESCDSSSFKEFSKKALGGKEPCDSSSFKEFSKTGS